jgi:lipopolysaccharide/colanic/teichoic acid biosynthesis glycosyltransferase
MEYTVIKQPRVIPNRRVYLTLKRMMDVAICLIIMPFAIPILMICSAAIFLNSPGPVFFIHDRMGKGGRHFCMYKFRTMRADLDRIQCSDFMRAYIRAEINERDDGKKIFKPVKDKDIFLVGRILRKLSLDELPQIINVLRGDMSIVGPRPNVLWEVESYYPWHHERFEVLPGITGLAQVRGRSCIDFASLVRYDIEYIEKQCLMLDFKILWWTFTATLRGIGAM